MSRFPSIRESTLLPAIGSVLPVSLQEAKAQCRVTEDSEDVYIDRLVRTAAEMVEKETGRISIRRSGIQTEFSAFPAGELLLPWYPLHQVDSVQYYNPAGSLVTLASSEYVVRTITTPGTLIPAPNKTWPATFPREDAVRITYSAGYANAATVDVRIKQVILLLVGHWFEHREASAVGVQAFEVPFGVQRMLSNLSTGVIR